MKRYNFTQLAPLNKLMSSVTDESKYINSSNDEILKELKDIDDKLIERWVTSNNTDFSIYQDIAYQKAGLYCHLAMTKRSCNETMKYITNNIDAPSKLDIFDDYNGIGTSTIFLMLQGLNVSYFNDNDLQIDSFKRLCKLHNLPVPFNDINRERKYDIVLSYEIAEHYQKPVEYLNSLLLMLKPGGILIISHSMNYPDAPGHFKFYNIDGVDYCNKSASRKFNNKIKEKCVQIHRGWNGTPLFYRKLNKSNLYDN